MGYIVVDEDKFRERVNLRNDRSYIQDALSDFRQSQVNYSHLLEALKEAENKVEEEIKRLQKRKSDIQLLMEYAK